MEAAEEDAVEAVVSGLQVSASARPRSSWEGEKEAASALGWKRCRRRNRRSQQERADALAVYFDAGTVDVGLQANATLAQLYCDQHLAGRHQERGREKGAAVGIQAGGPCRQPMRDRVVEIVGRHGQSDG